VSSRCEVLGRAAPLLVPLVEEGWIEGEVPRLAVERYLTPLCELGIDTLILGCTHYPVLRPLIDEVLATLSSRTVATVSSADAAANDVLDVLRARELLRDTKRGTTQFFVTDRPEQFVRVGTQVFGADVQSAELVDL
jgi:glutamate racemase